LDAFLGEIRLLSWNWAPAGWRLCDGSLLSVQQYSALFSLLGTQYGGNGVSNFALPDLRGRAPIHFSPNYIQGTPDGSEAVSVGQGQMPLHNHTLFGTSQTGVAALPNGHAYAQTSSTADPRYAADTATVTLNPASLQPNGGNLPHDNMQPFLVLNYCIATQGYFPPRG
jgi:microcystin-dependent protein